MALIAAPFCFDEFKKHNFDCKKNIIAKNPSTYICIYLQMICKFNKCDEHIKLAQYRSRQNIPRRKRTETKYYVIILVQLPLTNLRRRS